MNLQAEEEEENISVNLGETDSEMIEKLLKILSIDK